jgi:predicted PurR-regulated permease PerM
MNGARPHWNSRTKITISLLLLGLALYLLYRFSAILPPFILAVILAYILTPMVVFFQNRLRVPHTLAILLSYLVLLVAISILPLVVVPALAAQTTGLNLDIQRLLLQTESLLQNEYHLFGLVIPIKSILEQAIGSMQGWVEPVFGQTLGFAVEVISSLVWIIFILVVSFYLIKDTNSLHNWIETLPPPSYKADFIRLRDEINHIWGAFFRGQLILVLVVTTIVTSAGLMLGLPFALAMGVFAGILELLPSIGHGIWLTIAAILALTTGSLWIALPNWVFMLVVVGLHLIYQQFDINYLIPRIIGRSLHLPPLVVILGIGAGAVLAGVLGILLAAPTIASARVLGRYIYANLFDLEPFPESIIKPMPPPNPQWWRRPVASSEGERLG